ncbi:MFS transporter [Tellurirhabdus bombi]|uniref:MFS transporter n=1 Tax=Tellurirhabdus bombi TaxID=2907205 RepID=UPI001F2638B4|nr:MFS transporter [Tellurirhabdus bombi]
MNANFPTTLKSPKHIRIAIAGFFFISGFGFSTWASRIPSLQQQFGLNEGQLGAVLFALPMGLILTLPVTGFLVGRYSSRKIMLVGALLLNVILSLMGLANQTWQLALILFTFGAARNMLGISANAQSVGLQGLYDRSILASFHAIWSLAGFAGAALGSWMISANILPGYHFLIVSGVLSVLAILFFPNTLPESPTQQTTKAGFTLPDKSLLKFGLIAFASMACEGTIYDWSGVYFQKAVQVPKELTAVGFVSFMTAMTLGRLSGDWLVNRLGRKTILTYSGILMTAGLLLASVWPALIPASLGLIMVGLGVSCVIPLVMSLASQSVSERTGSVITSVSTVSYLGFLIVPPIVGFIAETLNLHWAFALMALLGLLTVWLVTKISISVKNS